MNEKSNQSSDRFAVRLNTFKNLPELQGATLFEKLINAVKEVEGISYADLNYPDHCEENSVAEVKSILSGSNIALNGFAMRYYTNPAFSLGAFTNPDKRIRREAIDLTKRGLDTLSELGGSLMTLWLGQDGFDYPFQADHSELWDCTVEAITEISDHNPDLNLSVEYKPNEPRAFSLFPDVATTLLAIREMNRGNIGVTLDFCHVLYADEMPSFSTMLVNRFSKLMGVHLNDGYGKRDDGLMVGTVHPVQLVEFLVQLQNMDYNGVYYFDTFPDQNGLDPLRETTTNLFLLKKFLKIARRLSKNRNLQDALKSQDATITQHIIASELYGGDE